ncbi:double-strand break repair helicase AddA [uncultured Albimonas sp.]|uniref:double-strand break repair helicase AddA n=1 Tax=uncultured Albimonas sp. TaxID=1331701 RepID=UPI0030EC1F65
MSAPHDAPHDVPHEAPHEATLAQVRASAPGASAWVAANAGSGKTSVLTRRVARLLLDGCKPEKILCLTYTRAAAAEMQARLFALLGEWSLQDDARLSATLRDLGLPGAPERADLRRARKLFAEALETPGGLKIQTIHAFCASLLRRFPLESGAPPGFKELDDAARAGMLDEIRDRLASEAEAAGAGAPFDAAADRLSEQGMESLTAAILGARDLFPDDPEPLLRAAFDISPAASWQAAAEREVSGMEADDLGRLLEVMARGKSTDAKFADELRPAWQALEAGDALAAALGVETAMHTKGGEPRKLSRLPTKAVAEAHPWTTELLEQLSDQAQELRAMRLAHAGFDKAMDLHRYARAVMTMYAAEKARAGAIDFDDLIRAAGALLTTSETAAWALWKLDGGLDHILIDEAQDTSPPQWALVRAIAEEFLAGQGAKDRPRTVFAVGDEKQSIYSFQGAAPREFGRMRAHFREFLAAAAAAGEGTALQESSLDFSFRSAPSILRLVDAAFESAAAALTAEAETPRHRAFHAAAPGRIDLWPLFETPEKAEPPAWHLPVDALPARAPVLRLADAVAAHVEEQIQTAAIPDPKAEGGWRRMRAGDVIVLLRRRGTLAGALVDRLKQRGVAVAGADRLRLTASLAVRDLLSLMRVALDPDDDLSTAEVLRSPLGGVSAQALEGLALGRGRSSLYHAVRGAEAAHPLAAALLSDVVGAADYERPHELLQRALVGHGGRARIRARLNPEEEDAVDELLARALAYEATETPTLPGFLAFMEASEDLTLKREMDGAGDAVRVMTVHAAKGLEAPFVILADAGPTKSPPGSDVLAHPCDPPVALWASPKAEEAPAMTAAKEARAEREADESLRLLYVALTRARSRLLVCGTLGAKADPEGSWHARVAEALEACDAAEIAAPDCLDAEPFDHVLSLSEGWTPPAMTGPAAAPTPDASPDAPPAGGPFRLAPDASERPLPTPRPRRRVAASALDREGEAAAPAAHAPPPHAPTPPAAALHDRETARRRGDAIHMLLEVLPPLPEALRETRAQALLATAHPELSEAVRAGCVAEALAALAHPDAAPWLTPQALAEASLSAELPGGLRLVGRVDRLAVSPGRVRLLDWKTGPRPEATPEAYLRQMAAYRHALSQLHPGAEIEAALFWTGAGRLDVLAPAALEAALDRLAADPRADRLAEPADPPNPAAEPV